MYSYTGHAHVQLPLPPKNYTFHLLAASHTNQSEIIRVTTKTSTLSDPGAFHFLVWRKEHAIGVIARGVFCEVEAGLSTHANCNMDQQEGR